MLHIRPFLTALLKKWWILLSCAAFTILGTYGAWASESGTWYFYASATLGVILLFVSAFLVWRAEYVANIQGPQVLMEWVSNEHCRDQITLRNLGPGTAFNIAFSEFSWTDVKWLMPVEIPFLNAGESRTMDAEFYLEVGPHSSEIGYLRFIFQKLDRKEPLTLSLRFRNMQHTRFSRRFTLTPVRAGRTMEISSAPGLLEHLR